MNALSREKRIAVVVPSLIAEIVTLSKKGLAGKAQDAAA
jgi:hypothetical protein